MDDNKTQKNSIYLFFFFPFSLGLPLRREWGGWNQSGTNYPKYGKYLRITKATLVRCLYLWWFFVFIYFFICFLIYSNFIIRYIDTENNLLNSCNMDTLEFVINWNSKPKSKFCKHFATKLFLFLLPNSKIFCNKVQIHFRFTSRTLRTKVTFWNAFYIFFWFLCFLLESGPPAPLSPRTPYAPI